MWEKTHTTFATDVSAEQIWKVWSDINNRPQWDIDTEWAELKGEFKIGAVFHFKPKGGPKLAMTITECTPNQSFTDRFKIPFARLYGIHRLEPNTNGLNIITTIQVTGFLGWLLRKCVAEKVAQEVPQQTAMLIKLAKTK